MGDPGRRRLGLFDATMLVMGAILGVGIFFTPGQVAALVPDPAAFLAVWAIGGGIAVCGAFTFAEFGASFPAAGGWFVYLREVFGRPIAFLLAWVVLLVVSTAALAMTSSFGAMMLSRVLPGIGEPGTPSQLAVAAAILVGLTAIALGGVKLGATFQNACMLIKLVAVVALITAGLFFAAAQAAPAPPPPPADHPLWQGMIQAMLPVLFACGGWTQVGYIASEIRDPVRNLPRAILLGVVSVMVLYLLLDLTYLRTVGLSELISNPYFATEVAERAFGESGRIILSLAMAVSAIGICAVVIITTPWLYVAMAREGLFFERFGHLHPQRGTPVLGLLLQGLFALSYLLLAYTTFTEEGDAAGYLVDSVVFVEWIFHGLAAFGLILLRYRRPDLPRPFRSWAFPLFPAIYGLCALGVVVGNLWQTDLAKTMTGLGVVAMGLLIYPVWRRIIGTSRG